MREVLFISAETELAALFHNGKEACRPLRNCLKELGHPQPPTQSKLTTALPLVLPTRVSNKSAPKLLTCASVGFGTACAKANSLCAGKMAASTKLTALPSTHHPTSHHQAVGSSYLHLPNDRSRNHFKCLQDADETDAAPVNRSVTFAG
jgi:hypothetical protein